MGEWGCLGEVLGDSGEVCSLEIQRVGVTVLSPHSPTYNFFSEITTSTAVLVLSTGRAWS